MTDYAKKVAGVQVVGLKGTLTNSSEDGLEGRWGKTAQV